MKSLNREVKQKASGLVLTLGCFEGHGAGRQVTHQPGHQELQVGDPGDSDVRQAVGRHSELVAPLVITAVGVEEKLQLGTSFECYFLQTDQV